MDVFWFGFYLILVLPLICSANEKADQEFLCSMVQTEHQKKQLIKTDLLDAELNQYQIVARFPHDTSAFTQGLVFYQDNLYESTGLINKSEVRKLNVNNGKVLLKTDIKDIYFGEGLALINKQLVQMSWKSGKVFFFNVETLGLIKTLSFDKEVWGSTAVNGQILISDGSSTLFYLDPDNLSTNKVLNISYKKQEISGLNELEYIENYIYANVWPTHCIVKIDPISGEVLGWLNLSKLYPVEEPLPDSAVLNGIAYDKQKKHLFVTGKFWPYLYEIKL